MTPQENFEHLKVVDISEIAMKPNLGDLNFPGILPKLQRIKGWFLEFEKLDYSSVLPTDAITSFEAKLNDYVARLQWLQGFDIKAVENPKNEHADFISWTEGFYSSFLKDYVGTYLPLLSINSDAKSKDKKQLDEEKASVLAIKKEAEKARDDLKKQLAELQSQKEKVSSKKGEIAAITFGKHFETQAEKHNEAADKWQKQRNIYFFILLGIIVLNVIFYLGLYVSDKFELWNLPAPEEIFTIQYGILKLALTAILSYAISFSSRHFTINSNLNVTNLHRKNIAETLTDFLSATSENDEIKAKLIDTGATSMFKEQSAGYIGKAEVREDGPLQSLIDALTFRR